MLKALLFDLNGVIVDSEGLNLKTWEKLFGHFNLDFNENIYRNSVDGKTTKEVIRLFINPDEISRVIEMKDKFWFELVNRENVRIFDDARRFLKAIKRTNIKTAIVTASRKTEYILKMLNLSNIFDAVISGNNIQNGKPNPEIIYKALKELSVSSNEAVLFEDSRAGLEAGNRAGVFCVALRFRQKDTAVKFNKEIDSFDCININMLRLETGALL